MITRTTIYTSFNDPHFAEKAAGALLDFGVQAEDLSLIQSENRHMETAEELIPNEVPPTLYVVPNVAGQATGFSPLGVTSMVEINEHEDQRIHHVNPRHLESEAKHGISTTTPEDAEAGAIAGGAWGAGLGVAAVLAAMFVPGVGVVIGGGALASAIGALAASTGAGVAAGAVTGYLKDQGVEAEVAEVYDNAIISGGAVLALTLPSGGVEESKAWEVLDKYGARNVTAHAGRPYLG